MINVEIIPGYCQCGCGGETALASYTQHGYRIGQRLRHLPRHHRRRKDCPIRLDESTPLVNGQHCCRWQWFVSDTGYGLYTVNHRRISAHRYIYQMQVGPIPTGFVLDHLCRNRDCVNFNHLEVVTHLINVRRGNHVKLTADQVREIRASAERQEVLARRFGVHPSQISRVKSRKSWRDSFAPLGKDGVFAAIISNRRSFRWS